MTYYIVQYLSLHDDIMFLYENGARIKVDELPAYYAMFTIPYKPNDPNRVDVQSAFNAAKHYENPFIYFSKDKCSYYVFAFETEEDAMMFKLKYT